MAIIDILPARWRMAAAHSLLKANALPIVPDWVRASFIEPTWSNLIKEGWKANAAVYGCVSALSMAFPEPQLGATNAEGNPIDDRHPLQKLLNKPNSLMGQAEFATYLITYLAIGGNVYLHKLRNNAGQVVALYPYHAGQMKPVPGAMAWVKAYAYDKGDGREEIIPVEDVIHIKWPLPDPDQPWQATPPILHVAREVDTDNEATRYLFALLKNDALPRTVIEMPEEAQLSADEFKRLKRQFNQRYGGSKRGSVGLLEGGATLKRIGLDLKELAFEALRRVPEARIAAAFRVPAIVAGLNVGLENATYANYSEAVRQFTEGTLVPLWRLVASELTQSLASEFDGDLVVGYDLSNVRALQENENDKWNRLDMAVRGGWMTVNEARQAIGLEAVSGGDVFLRSMTMINEPGGGEGKLLADVLAVKGLREIEAKADRLAAERQVGETLIALRKATSQNMAIEIDDYFTDLADRVAGRAVNVGKAGSTAAAKKNGKVATKTLPTIDDLLKDSDDDDLIAIVKRFYADLLHVSWNVWNISLGTSVAFDLTDPAVTEILDEAATRVRDISATTRQEIIDLLTHGNEHGWSIDQLVRGDAEEGIAGLRDIVKETYHNRARTIARTELGEAQQKASVSRYQDAGVEDVLILDNGFDNSHETCKWLNGQTRPLEWTKRDHPNEGPSGVKNPLQHPNCVRCFAPHFGD